MSVSADTRSIWSIGAPSASVPASTLTVPHLVTASDVLPTKQPTRDSYVVTRSAFRFGSGTRMTEESIVSVLKPAMKIAQVPEWTSARWVGGLDLPAKLAPSIELLDSSGMLEPDYWCATAGDR